MTLDNKTHLLTLSLFSWGDTPPRTTSPSLYNHGLLVKFLVLLLSHYWSILGPLCLFGQGAIYIMRHKPLKTQYAFPLSYTSFIFWNNIPRWWLQIFSSFLPTCLLVFLQGTLVLRVVLVTEQLILHMLSGKIKKKEENKKNIVSCLSYRERVITVKQLVCWHISYKEVESLMGWWS